MNRRKFMPDFHGQQDKKIPGRIPSGPLDIKKELIQEREVSYDFSLHQHPYVQELTQRLLRAGVSGLQATDTEYADDNASRPGSLEIALVADSPLRLALGLEINLLSSVQATNEAGGPLTLDVSEGMTLPLKLNSDSGVNAPLTLRATLIEGMKDTPSIGSEFLLEDAKEAILAADTIVSLTQNTDVTLPSGEKATIPQGTEVRIAEGDLITLLPDTKVRLRRSKPLPILFKEFFSAYGPNSDLAERPYPANDLDFSSGGAYAAYNWELFYHVPLAIAIHLSKNDLFAEAQRWLHFLFDPTDDSDGPTPERFWKVHPFRTTDVKKIEEILINLATGSDPKLQAETVLSIDAWKDAPFRPHVIARYRQQAYMIKTVTTYLDNLIAWGDSLFRQDTGEAIDEAMMVYVLAANILGPRPQSVPQKGTVRSQTYANLREDLRQFGTVMRDMEAALPFNLLPDPSLNGREDERTATIRSLGKALYFCVPRNDNLLRYWDTVADRLFKIRNSLNFQGVFRQLALFEPPIDPTLLARAAAAGLDVGAIVNGLNQPLPLVRFQMLAQRASEITQEVKSLGNALLSAMEKEDGEALAILRAKHERVVMELVEHVRYGQLQETIKAKEGVLQSLALAVQRYTYYERQLGRETDEIENLIPELEELDKESLANMKFAMEESEIGLRDIDINTVAVLADIGGPNISSYEAFELGTLVVAQLLQDQAAVADIAAGVSAAFPKARVHATPLGPGASTEFGGDQLASIFRAVASGYRGVSSWFSFAANMSSKMGAYSRREQDWEFQSNLAAGEISQIFKQLRAAQIREAVAELELKNHRQQMQHAEEIERFLNEEGTEKGGKQANKALYTWMKREVKGLYSQCFQLAFDTAKKAERALQHELGNPTLNYLQFGYLGGHQGFLAGEKLYLDIKRMEMAYYDLNQREYELTKHVSLLQVDPLALIRLRATGRCTVQLPESLFDMDGPGHYFRRIQTVAVSIPCVTGPYASVNCTLTLQKSSIRKTPDSGEQYERSDAEDTRFSDNFSSTESIVTSSAQNDSGLFETNLRDERYLPFEHSGVISEWQLQLPANPSNNDPAQFDYNTISDVILHIRYTAREGGQSLRTGAVSHIKTQIETAEAPGTTRLFSMRHEFPNEWAKFQRPTLEADQKAELALTLRPEHYPFWSQGRLDTVNSIQLLARSRSVEAEIPSTIIVSNREDDTGQSDEIPKDQTRGSLLVGSLKNIPLPPSPTTDLKLFFNNNELADLWIAVEWSGTE